jgi:hypothetical protein
VQAQQRQQLQILEGQRQPHQLLPLLLLGCPVLPGVLLLPLLLLLYHTARAVRAVPGRLPRVARQQRTPPEGCQTQQQQQQQLQVQHPMRQTHHLHLHW